MFTRSFGATDPSLAISVLLAADCVSQLLIVKAAMPPACRYATSDPARMPWVWRHARHDAIQCRPPMSGLDAQARAPSPPGGVHRFLLAWAAPGRGCRSGYQTGVSARTAQA